MYWGGGRVYARSACLSPLLYACAKQTMIYEVQHGCAVYVTSFTSLFAEIQKILGYSLDLAAVLLQRKELGSALYQRPFILIGCAFTCGTKPHG